MPYDKYRNWKTSLGGDDIKEQVLRDLLATVAPGGVGDDIDRLEILDSYESFVERKHDEELAEHFALLILNNMIRPLLVEFTKSRMPGSMPISRGRPAAPTSS